MIFRSNFLFVVLKWWDSNPLRFKTQAQYRNLKKTASSSTKPHAIFAFQQILIF